MSDFFGDDFTLELKAYFLDNLHADVEKALLMAAGDKWQSYRAEILEKLPEWQKDARTNEFVALTAWLESLEQYLHEIKEPSDFVNALKKLTDYLEALSETKKETEEITAKFVWNSQVTSEEQFLFCKMGRQAFALPVKSVIEVISNLRIYPLPHSQPGILGMIAVRGDVVPVFNLQDHGFESSEIKTFYFVICEHLGTKFAVQVTETDRLISISGRDLQVVDEKSRMVTPYFVSNFVLFEEKSVMIFDPEKLVAA